MNNPTAMQIINNLQNLREIINHNFPLLLGQLHLFIDNLHQIKNIAVRTQLHHDADVVILTEIVEDTYDTRMCHLAQEDDLYDCFVHFIHF